MLQDQREESLLPSQETKHLSKTERRENTINIKLKISVPAQSKKKDIYDMSKVVTGIIYYIEIRLSRYFSLN